MSHDPSLVSRPADPEEHEDVLRLILESYREFADALEPQHRAQLLTNLGRAVESTRRGRLFVVEGEGRLIGTVTYFPPGSRAHEMFPDEWAVIRLLAVDPLHRRKGLGRRLSEECVALARFDRAPAVGLHTSEFMLAARAMYEAMGFKAQRSFAHLGHTFWIYTLNLARDLASAPDAGV